MSTPSQAGELASWREATHIHPWSDAARPRSHRALDQWLAQRIMAGWSPRAIVAACDNAMSIRTVYRWRKRLVSVTYLRAGGWEALYALVNDGPPVRLGEWERTEGARMIGLT